MPIEVVLKFETVEEAVEQLSKLGRGVSVVAPVPKGQLVRVHEEPAEEPEEPPQEAPNPPEEPEALDKDALLEFCNEKGRELVAKGKEQKDLFTQELRRIGEGKRVSELSVEELQSLRAWLLKQ